MVPDAAFIVLHQVVRGYLNRISVQDAQTGNADRQIVQCLPDTVLSHSTVVCQLGYIG